MLDYEKDIFNKGYKLSEETKKRLSDTIGIPYEKLIKMDDDEITAYIEQKNGKKMRFSRPNPMFSGSGDDSVLIDRGRFRTIDDVDKRMDEIVKHHKSKSTKQQPLSIEDEDILSK